MKTLYTGIFLLMTGLVLAQPFAIGRTTLNLTDPTRNNRSVPTEVYYPASTAGVNVPITTQTTETFPVISFGHGFLMTWDAYQNIWEALVPQGYIVAFPKTEGSFSPSHLEFGKDLAFVVTSLQQLGTNSSSLFHNRVGTNSALMGHSMGGGSAHLAHAFLPNVTTLMTLAPAETNPSAVSAAATISQPSLVIAGANDCVTPPSQHQIPIFNALNSECKSYVSITGGSHCFMANSNFFCNIGESSCTPAPTITRAQQQFTLNAVMLAWLDAYLKDDCQSQTNWPDNITTIDGITGSTTCDPCTLGVPQQDRGDLYWYPNPVGDWLFFHSEEWVMLNYRVFNSQGQLVKNSLKPLNSPIAMGDLSRGLYIIQWEDDSGNSYQHKLIKQ